MAVKISWTCSSSFQPQAVNSPFYGGLMTSELKGGLRLRQLTHFDHLTDLIVIKRASWTSPDWGQAVAF